MQDECDYCQKPETECRCFHCKVCGDFDCLITPPDQTTCRCAKLNPPDSKASHEAAEALKAKGIQPCYVCGRAKAACDKEAEEIGWDDCEEWASH